MGQVRLAWRLGMRDLRGAWRGLRIVVACLALGVAAIATVGGLRAAVEGGIRAHGREILGGDLEIGGGNQELPPTLIAWLHARGARTSAVWQLRSMLIAPNGERQLVELKAVDDAWPLLGSAVAAPPLPVAVALQDGLLVEQLIPQRLNTAIGQQVRLGDLSLAVRGILTQEPDHAGTPSLMGPRALIALKLLPRTGLIRPGSMVNHVLRVVWPAKADQAALMDALRRDFPHNGWRLRDVHDAVPGATRFIDQLAAFLSLISLAALLVGGIGVATGVRAWLDGRARSIAVLRCLGASGRLVFAVAFVQVGVLAGLGILMGLMAGAVLPTAALMLLGNALPVPVTLGPAVLPLGLAALFGVLTALTFALLPLSRAMRIPGAALFRDTLLPQSARPSGGWLAANAVLAAGLIGLSVATSADRWLAASFCAAAVVVLGVFRLGAAGLTMAARRSLLGFASPSIRLGIRNLCCPGNTTALMLVALGLGLTTLAATALVEGNLSAQITGQLPTRAPSFYFIDIQPDQVARFGAVARSVPSVSEVLSVPNLVARVVAVNGVDVEHLHPTADTAWAMRGDRGLTYAAVPPVGTRIVAGQWWPADYAGPPLVSFDAGLAHGWGVTIGDTITVAIAGRHVTLRIASLRQIDWRSLSMNFAMVVSPGLLSGAPHTNLATVRVDPAQDGALLRAVTDALPNVTGINVAGLLATVGTILGQIGTALATSAALTLAAGALVMAGAVASGQRRRMREAVILKTLGATTSQIRTAWMVEFGALGLAAGCLAAVIGTMASYAVMHWVMHAGWALLPGRLAFTLVGCVTLMLGLGYAGTAGALRAKVAPVLRNE